MAGSDEDVPHADQYAVLAGSDRGYLQLQADAFAYARMRIVGRKLGIGERRSEAFVEYQDLSGEERKYAVAETS